MGRKRARLLLYGSHGSRIERPVGRERLDQLLERCTGASAAARTAWDRSGTLTTRHLLRAWPPDLVRPSAAFLRSGDRFRTGMTLHVEAPGLDLEELADDLLACLEGRRPARRYDARPSDAAGGAPPDAAVELELEPPPEAAAPTAPAGRRGEILPPGVQPEEALEEGEEVFGLAEAAAAGRIILDDSLDLRPEDLEGLLPGDGIVSDARGRCRILQVEDDLQAVLLEDARGRSLRVERAELLQEFRFDGGEED